MAHRPHLGEVWIAGPRGKPSMRLVSRTFYGNNPPMLLYREVGKLRYIRISVVGWLDWVRRTAAVLSPGKPDNHYRKERDPPVEDVSAEAAEERQPHAE